MLFKKDNKINKKILINCKNKWNLKIFKRIFKKWMDKIQRIKKNKNKIKIKMIRMTRMMMDGIINMAIRNIIIIVIIRIENREKVKENDNLIMFIIII